MPIKLCRRSGKIWEVCAIELIFSRSLTHKMLYAYAKLVLRIELVKKCKQNIEN